MRGSAQQCQASWSPGLGTVWLGGAQWGRWLGSRRPAPLPTQLTDSPLGPSVFHLQRWSGCSPAKRSSGVIRPVLQGVVVGARWAFIPRAQSLCLLSPWDAEGKLRPERGWPKATQPGENWDRPFPALGPIPWAPTPSCLGDFLPKTAGSQPFSSAADKHFCQPPSHLPHPVSAWGLGPAPASPGKLLPWRGWVLRCPWHDSLSSLILWLCSCPLTCLSPS